MKNGMNFIKGVGTGMVAGIAVAASVKCLCDKNKKLCKIVKTPSCGALSCTIVFTL